MTEQSCLSLAEHFIAYKEFLLYVHSFEGGREIIYYVLMDGELQAEWVTSPRWTPVVTDKAEFSGPPPNPESLLTRGKETI